MASSIHSKTVRVNQQTARDFLQDKDGWAVLIPGYLNHEIISEKEMIWVFKGDFGFIQKAVKLQLNVQEVIEQNKISFELVGLSDNINGSGYFEMKIISAEDVEIVGNLDMKAGGFLASMINPVLETFVPQTIEQLVEAIADILATQNISS